MEVYIIIQDRFYTPQNELDNSKKIRTIFASKGLKK